MWQITVRDDAVDNDTSKIDISFENQLITERIVHFSRTGASNPICQRHQKSVIIVAARLMKRVWRRKMHY